VKMNPRLLAVAVLLATLCMPASLMATSGIGPDGNPNDPPPIVHPAPLPPDGNPWPHMKGAQAPNVEQPAPPPDGNPWPH